MPSFYEFFAGGGMVRAGLGEGWTCLFANDIDPRKARSYRANWGEGEMRVADVRDIDADSLPGAPDLVWGSFPCQDLSLAGMGAGLGGQRSGAFYPFWTVVRDLIRQDRAPPLIALENVVGALSSHGGRDFAALCGAFADAGYRFGALVIDAALFVPQSRPRLFFIGVREDLPIHPSLLSPEPQAPFHPPPLRKAMEGVDALHRSRALWWSLPVPPSRNLTFVDVLEEEPADVDWHTDEARDRLLSRMSPVNFAKVRAAMQAGRRMVGGVYRRTRQDAAGAKTQRAEVRFDDLAGCLRTPAGGSSRQMIMVVEGERVRTRLISSRETARLMGLEDSYALPANYNEAYHLTGDGVVAPVVRHLAARLFEPLLQRTPPAAA